MQRVGLGPFFSASLIFMIMKRTVEIEQCKCICSKHKEKQFIIIYVLKIGNNKRHTYILHTLDFEMIEPLTSGCKQEKEETIINIVQYILEKKKRRYNKFIVNLSPHNSRYRVPSCPLSNYLYERIMGLSTISDISPKNQPLHSTINIWIMHFLKRKSRVKIYKFFLNRKYSIYWEIQDLKTNWQYYSLSDRILICLSALIIVAMITGMIYLTYLNNKYIEKSNQLPSTPTETVQPTQYDLYKYEEKETIIHRQMRPV